MKTFEKQGQLRGREREERQGESRLKDEKMKKSL